MTDTFSVRPAEAGPQLETTAEERKRWDEVRRDSDFSRALRDIDKLIAAVARAHSAGRREGLEEAAKIVKEMPIQIYRDGPTAAERSCKEATFDDAAAAIRAKIDGGGQ